MWVSWVFGGNFNFPTTAYDHQGALSLILPPPPPPCLVNSKANKCSKCLSWLQRHQTKDGNDSNTTLLLGITQSTHG